MRLRAVAGLAVVLGAVGDVGPDVGRRLASMGGCPTDWSRYFTAAALDGVLNSTGTYANTTETTTTTTRYQWSTQPPASTTAASVSAALKTTPSAASVTPSPVRAGVSTTTTTTTTTTSTTTRSSTTSTTTSSATRTVTTTVIHPCSICHLYHYLCPDGCSNCIEAGTCRTMYQRLRDFSPGCTARRVPAEVDDCIEFSHLTLQCPADNFHPDQYALPIEGQYPLLRCKVCSLSAPSGDRDPRRGLWAGTVGWGPNQFERSISETSVQAYRLYVVDDALEKLGKPLAERAAKLWATNLLPDSSSCDALYYQADLAVALPARAASFMVVPVTRGGTELHIGPTAAIDDIATVAVDGAARCGRRALLAAAAAWLAAAIAL
mmetsp:Transcript_51805/g.143461  ORF Transcript_51805/g.143461 Transcript_51805/m.143461 type:complete len:378 (+) Transcript_51805:65-1198(+)